MADAGLGSGVPDFLNESNIGFLGLSKDVEINELIIPEGVKYIDEGTFENFTIKKLICPSTLEVIDTRAFKNCKIKILEFKQSINSLIIGKEAFENNFITTLIFPNIYLLIEIRAFANNPITTLLIPQDNINDIYDISSTATKIEIFDDAFENTNIKNLYVKSNNLKEIKRLLKLPDTFKFLELDEIMKIIEKEKHDLEYKFLGWRKAVSKVGETSGERINYLRTSTYGDASASASSNKYYLKYLKYKNKYLELKSKLTQ